MSSHNPTYALDAYQRPEAEQLITQLHKNFQDATPHNIFDHGTDFERRAQWSSIDGSSMVVESAPVAKSAAVADCAQAIRVCRECIGKLRSAVQALVRHGRALGDRRLDVRKEMAEMQVARTRRDWEVWKETTKAFIHAFEVPSKDKE